MEQEEGFFQHLSDEVLLMIVKFAYDAHDVVLADAEHRSPPPAADRALVEVMSALGLVSRRWRRVACDPTLWRQRHDTVFGGAPFPHLRPPFPHIAWRQAYLAKAKRWWSVRNSRIPPQGGCHPPILFAVVEGAPALLDRLLMTEKPDTVAEALSCLSAQNLVQANSLEVALKVLQAREARGGERDYEEWYLTTPIYEAACWGNVELVKLMLDRRRHPSGLLTLGTAMQLAAREGREQVVRYFVDNELALAHDPVANVQEQSVVLAASRGHAKTVEALLEGYPPDLFDIDDDKDDKTGRGARETLRMALISAVSGGHVETVRVLVEEVDYNWQLVHDIMEQEVKTIDLGAIDALLPDPADEPAGSQQGAVRKKWSGRLLSSRWMRTAAETSPALAIELGWLLMAKGFDIDSGCPLNALQIAAQAQESESLVNCLLSMGANPKARGSPGSASPEVLAGLKGNTTIVDALSAAAASRGVTPATATPLIALKTTTEHEEIVPDAGKKRKAPNPPDDADDEEAGGGDDGATSVKRRRTEGNEVRRMAELIREWVAERWSEVTAHDWIPRHFTTFYLRAQLRQCGLQPQGDERVELMRQLAEHIAKSRRKRHAILQDEDPVVYTRVELPDPFQLFIIPSAGALAPHLFAPLVL